MNIPAPAFPKLSKWVSRLVVASTLMIAGCAHVPVTPVEFAVFVELGEIDGEALPAAARSTIVVERGFELVRSSLQFASLHMETAWMDRPPFDDEVSAGVIEARSRLIIRGQRRGGGAYAAVLEAENEIRSDSVRTWHGAPVSHSFRAWITEIADELREESGA